MLQSTLFPVTEVPAVGIPEDGKEIDSTGYKFIVREDTGKVLSCMTNDYKLVKIRRYLILHLQLLKKEMVN